MNTMAKHTFPASPHTRLAQGYFGYPSSTFRAKGIGPSIVLAAALLCTSQVGAQSKTVEGFSTALSVNASSNSIDSSATDGVSTSSGGITSHSNSLGIQLQYALALGNRTALAMGLSSVFGGVLIGQFIPTGEKVDIEDMTSLYLAPGVFASDRTYFYGKVGAVTARSSFGGGNRIDGTGYGIGAHYVASENIFFQAELLQNTFRASNHDYIGLHFTDNYVVNMLSVSMGYKF